MAIVTELLGSGNVFASLRGTTKIRRWRVIDVAIGESPFDPPEIPRIGTADVANTGGGSNRVVYLESLQPTKINDTAYVVEATYTEQAADIFQPSGPNRSWDITYRKEQIEIPIFVRGLKFHSGGSTQYWDPAPRSLDIEWMVLNVSVDLYDLGNAGIRDAINTIQAQIGHIHIFSGFPTIKWRMLAPKIANVPESRRRITIGYSWESDPGNGAIDAPPETPQRPFVPITAPKRLPFYTYLVFPSQTIGGRPSIDTMNLYPQTDPQTGQPNPYYTPTGYNTLPGNPI